MKIGQKIDNRILECRKCDYCNNFKCSKTDKNILSLTSVLHDKCPINKWDEIFVNNKIKFEMSSYDWEHHNDIITINTNKLNYAIADFVSEDIPVISFRIDGHCDNGGEISIYLNGFMILHFDEHISNITYKDIVNGKIGMNNITIKVLPKSTWNIAIIHENCS
jgi:hypothetical protein